MTAMVSTSLRSHVVAYPRVFGSQEPRLGLSGCLCSYILASPGRSGSLALKGEPLCRGHPELAPTASEARSCLLPTGHDQRLGDSGHDPAAERARAAGLPCEVRRDGGRGGGLWVCLAGRPPARQPTGGDLQGGRGHTDP